MFSFYFNSGVSKAKSGVLNRFFGVFMINECEQRKFGPLSLADVANSSFQVTEEKGLCNKHGVFTAIAIAGRSAVCPFCMEEKLKGEADALVGMSVEAMNISRREAMFVKAGVPERYRDKGFDNYRIDGVDQADIVSKIIAYASDFSEARRRGTCLIMSGINGTGKSHLAVAVVESVVNQGYTALFVSALEALRSITSCYSSSSKTTQEDAYLKLSAPDLLVLDDIGTENHTDSTVQIIYEIIYSRYHANKPTIITTNDKIAELNVLIGERTVDRLRENGGMYLPFDWKSIRGELK